MCKLEHYGNCDPETKDQEYCIFHKPNKTEEEAKEFWRKFLQRFKPKKETIEFLGKEIERLVFEDVVDCRGFVFSDGSSPLSYAVFKKNVYFNWATFEGFADFIKITFEGEIYFIGATFKLGANFYGCIFKGYTWFTEVTFRSNIKFSEAIFEEEVYFKDTEFENADFSWAKFNKYADFKYSVFKGYTDFKLAEFKDVDFQYATFKGDVSFGGAFIKRAVFLNKSDKEKYKFYGKLNFVGTEIIRVMIDLPSEWFRLPEAEAEACRVQRICYEKEGNKYKADEMFLRERRALRRAKVRQAKEQLNKSNGVKSKLKALINLFKAYIGASIEFILADLTCGYGTNWIKPIALWIFTVLILCPLLYLVTNSIPNAYDFLSCLYFSIVTATTLGYGDLHPVGIGRALASAEAIFGTFMWAVFLAVFARKYMR